MSWRTTKDKAAIEEFLAKDTLLHIYELGDLADFYWPHTTWYTNSASPVSAMTLLYTASTPPTLLAFEREANQGLSEMLPELARALPAKLYAHISPHLVSSLQTNYSVSDYGLFLKMALGPPKLDVASCAPDCERFTSRHKDELEAFYREAYPANWFDARMLETGHYLGAREGGRIAAVAGIHVYSKEHGVAALGNIATATWARRRGFGRTVTARLCSSLLETVSEIGLNVSAENQAAIQCYRSLGFEVIAEYRELGLVALCS